MRRTSGLTSNWQRILIPSSTIISSAIIITQFPPCGPLSSIPIRVEDLRLYQTKVKTQRSRRLLVWDPNWYGQRIWELYVHISRLSIHKYDYIATNTIYPPSSKIPYIKASSVSPFLCACGYFVCITFYLIFPSILSERLMFAVFIIQKHRLVNATWRAH